MKKMLMDVAERLATDLRALSAMTDKASAGFQNALMDKLAALPSDKQAMLTRALFQQLPKSKTSSKPTVNLSSRDVDEELEQLRKSHAKDPTYGGFFMPCLEMIARADSDAIREQFRLGLVRMLHSSREKRRFAAAVFAGILGFAEYLQDYVDGFKDGGG